jgi:hypothetical protein
VRGWCVYKITAGRCNVEFMGEHPLSLLARDVLVRVRNEPDLVHDIH